MINNYIARVVLDTVNGYYDIGTFRSLADAVEACADFGRVRNNRYFNCENPLSDGQVDHGDQQYVYIDLMQCGFDNESGPMNAAKVTYTASASFIKHEGCEDERVLTWTPHFVYNDDVIQQYEEEYGAL